MDRVQYIFSLSNSESTILVAYNNTLGNNASPPKTSICHEIGLNDSAQVHSTIKSIYSK